MSFDTVRRDIEKRFDANWIVTKVSYDNIDFEPPNRKGKEYWVRLRIFEDAANRMNIGNPGIHRTSGTIIIELYAPLNVGTNTLRSYASDAATIFRDKQFNGITCQEAIPTNVGELDGWFIYNVSIPFYYDGRYAV